MRTPLRKQKLLVCAWLGALLLAGCQSPYLSGSFHHKPTPPRRETPLWTGYDATFADAIQARWFQLMDERPIPQDTGRIVLEFRLHPDGTIDDLFIAQNTEGEVFGAICAKAVLDPVPFKTWSSGMQQLFGQARRFRVSFEFDARGMPYLGYTEDRTELARSGKAPSETLLVLTYSRQHARVVD